MTDVARILDECNVGSEDAKEELLEFAYAELKRQARFLMSRERSDHTLQPTALVHETYLRMGRSANVVWEDMAHFYGFASRVMRQVLVDHARRHASAKRGSNPVHFSVDEVDVPIGDRADSILALDAALHRLALCNERQARIVEMRFFGGMTDVEIADALDIASRTVRRDWQAARLWLYSELKGK